MEEKGAKYMFGHRLDNKIILPRLCREDLMLQFFRSAGLQCLDDWHCCALFLFLSPIVRSGVGSEQKGSKESGESRMYRQQSKFSRAEKLGAIYSTVESRTREWKGFRSKVR
jgi:hypothetical protein